MTDTTEHPITIDSLARDGLLNPDDARNLYPLEEDLNKYLAGPTKRARETYLTYLLASSSGPLERAVIDYLCEVADGIEPEPGMRLISGDEFNQPGRKTIDLVVAKKVDGRWVPLIAVEAKFNAPVNGHRRYCTKLEKGSAYSNQAICYLHGCLHDDLHEKKVKFVWLGKPNTRPDLGAWGSKGVHAGDIARYPDYFGDGIGPQTDAAERWCFATWDMLEEKIAAAIPGPNGSAIVKALRAGW